MSRNLSCGEREILNQDRDDEDEGPDARRFRSGTATARKHHKCIGCPGGRIAPGDRYSYWVGILEREYTVDRMCLPGARAPGCDWESPAPKRSVPTYGPDEIPF